MRLIAALLFLSLSWLPGCSLAAEGDVQPIPALTTPLTDTANLLSASDAAALNQKLAAFSQAKGSQIAVLIVPTTAPEDIFAYSFRVADNWKLGRKGIDDGVLLVIAVQDRKSNLQIGYGLEGAIPDARSKQVLDDIIRPYFRNGDFAGGLNAGTDALIKLINGENLAAPTQQDRHGKSKNNNILIIAIIAGALVGMMVRSFAGNLFGGITGGGIALAVAWLLGAAIAMAILAAVVAAVAASANGNRGFGGGGFGGGGFGGGSFGGGGFGGGGGGFGGGGSSGSW